MALLDGLRVLDLSQGPAGALATMLLADNGAEVVKVEPPGGDWLRGFAPHHVWNRSKLSVACDLKTVAGRARFDRLCARADILVDTFRPATAERLGVDATTIGRKHPALVHVSIGGYGAIAGRRDEPGYESLVDAWLGIQDEQMGHRAGPHYNVLMLGCYGAAFLAVTGAMAAVHARRQTGRGQHVETSLLDGALILNTMTWQKVEGEGERQDKIPTGLSLSRRHLLNLGMLPCGDERYIQLHSGQPGRFHKAMEVLGLADRIAHVPPAEERATPLSPTERAFLEDSIPRALKSRPRAEWLELFLAADIAAMPVDPPADGIADPQVVQQRFIVDVPDTGLGAVRMVGPVLRGPEQASAAPVPAPAFDSTDAAALWTTDRPADGRGATLRHPLQGVRIVDFGSFFAGPYASRLLADLGADVIKVEPLSGDGLRPSSGVFRAANRGKRDVAIDLKNEEGRGILRRLIQTADVVTHNMRAGAAERLGFGYDDVRALKPDVIYLHSSGFGSDGPRAKEGAFAPLVAGMCGLSWQAGGRGNPPVQSVSNEDHHSGCLGAVWLSMALYRRARTGEPVHLQTSLLGATYFVMSELLLRPDNTPLFSFELDQAQTGVSPLCRLYQASDGWISLVVVKEGEWRALASLPGLDLPAHGGRSVTALCAAEGAAIAGALAAWFAARTSAGAISLLRAAGVPAEVSRPTRRQSFFDDPANLASGLVVELDYPEQGRVRDVGHVIRFSATPGRIEMPCPRLGEHTDAVIASLGFDAGAIADLRRRRVVA